MNLYNLKQVILVLGCIAVLVGVVLGDIYLWGIVT